jgi:hypothetical protein
MSDLPDYESDGELEQQLTNDVVASLLDEMDQDEVPPPNESAGDAAGFVAQAAASGPVPPALFAAQPATLPPPAPPADPRVPEHPLRPAAPAASIFRFRTLTIIFERLA